MWTSLGSFSCNTTLVYAEHIQCILLFLFCSTVCSSDPNTSTSVTDRNTRNSLQPPPCYRKKKKFSVPHPFTASYLGVLYFALKYQIKETRLIIRLFPFAFLFHNFACAHLFTKQYNRVSTVTKMWQNPSKSEYLEEQVCYTRHSTSKTHLSITTLEGMCHMLNCCRPLRSLRATYNLPAVPEHSDVC